MRRLLDWAPAIAWAALIWTFSSQHFAAESTGHLLRPLLQWLLPGASYETLEQLHWLLRKTGHFVEYFVFALLVARGVRGRASGWQARWGGYTLAIVFLYAALDEWHQSFVPTRTAAVADVALDVVGGAAAIALLWWRARRHNPVRANPAL
ncbi:MAG: VanZ family protein [Acidobacteriia bacterium]|jgi:VanZ family protein|nr:VanZ family protein [Terriglobia bacterium]